VDQNNAEFVDRLISWLVGKRGALSRIDCHRRMAVWWR